MELLQVLIMWNIREWKRRRSMVILKILVFAFTLLFPSFFLDNIIRPNILFASEILVTRDSPLVFDATGQLRGNGPGWDIGADEYYSGTVNPPSGIEVIYGGYL
jgi:hypothetical protein